MTATSKYFGLPYARHLIWGIFEYFTDALGSTLSESEKEKKRKKKRRQLVLLCIIGTNYRVLVK